MTKVLYCIICVPCHYNKSINQSQTHEREMCIHGSRGGLHWAQNLPITGQNWGNTRGSCNQECDRASSIFGAFELLPWFLPNVAGILAPLHELLKKWIAWHWGNGQQSAFEASKDLLQSEQVLVHYQPDVDLVVSCDSPGFGLGPVLSHRFPDGTERGISVLHPGPCQRQRTTRP